MNRLALVLVLCVSAAYAAKRPNVILMVTDDQGYGDIAAHGNPVIQTPEMDRLHSQSIRLTDFHVDPTCAPTRGALMSGKFSHRARVWHTVRGGNHLREGEITMADVFKHNGYDTAMFGKWHLGANYPYRPMDRGFDEWLGLGDGGPNTSDCWFWNDRVNDMYWHNGEREYREGFNPDVFYREAGEYVKKHKGEKPFFIYLPTYVPHKPYSFPAPDFHEKYLAMGLEKELVAFYASIARVDWNIGQLRKTLEEKGIADNTILIFMTDNGSTHTEVFNAGMSGHKGSTNEGGHRVPCFIHWPAGKLGAPRDISNLTAHIDVLPTLMELCGMQSPEPMDLDGKSLVPLFHGKTPDWQNRTLVVEKQRQLEYNRKYNAIMNGSWRLLGHSKLYDISKDPAQKTNVAKEHPEVVEKLLKDFEAYWKRVTPDDRSFPTPIAGTPYDEELLLGISELRDGDGYAHGYCAEGREAKGIWHIEAAVAGIYEIEVRRWPKEAEAPFDGVPKVNKTVDAWSTRGPKTTFLTSGKITALPIGSVSLKAGEFYEKRAVGPEDKALIFDVELPKGVVTIDAVFYDKNDKRMTNAYYVYVRKG
ncbi:Arylsulfatase [Pontiella sulfatireligans]|uniref:Arylsulfatase n=2 Tax=Pontiella sulfatireligans TaxID=2750658 RepID=A0A6C2UFD2_9BACT|nr:sulfatase S1_17 [Kiritimatiellales bacterium]VGO18922.1 Arylsulfatase [Pontiella sulfatireligans]